MSIKSPVAVMQALEMTFSSSRTFPGQGCCSNTDCALRERPGIFLPYASLYFFKEILNQERNVFRPLAQRRNANLNRIQPIKKIFPEAPGQNFSAEIAIRGRDQVHVDLFHFRRPDLLNLAVLDHAQQLGLHRHRSLADLIEKDRASVRVLEKAWPGVGRSRERPVTCPNSWLSSSVSTSAEQLHTAKRWVLTGLNW